MTAKALVLSPYTLRLETAIDADVYERMRHYDEVTLPNGRTATEMLNDWDRVVESAKLTMKNGEKLSFRMSCGGNGEEDFIIDFFLEVVIDPEQVASFSYGDLTVNF